jgi:hypothetical protein
VAIPKDHPVSMERAMIGRTRTCRIFAGLFIGRGSFWMGTTPALSFWAARRGARNKSPKSPKKGINADFRSVTEGKVVLYLFMYVDKKQAN